MELKKVKCQLVTGVGDHDCIVDENGFGSCGDRVTECIWVMALNTEQIQVARRTIILAKKQLEKGDFDSVHLANYMLRDLDATKGAGLSDLAWALHRNQVHKNDVLGLIRLLETHLDKEIENDQAQVSSGR